MPLVPKCYGRNLIIYNENCRLAIESEDFLA